MSNQERQTAYRQVVQALLECSQNDEQRILAANADLVDKGLVKALKDKTMMMMRRNDPALGAMMQRLVSLAQQLERKLASAQSETVELEPEDYIRFSFELFQIVARSKGDGAIVHQFFDEHRAYFNEHLVAIFPQSIAALLARSTDPDRQVYIRSIAKMLAIDLQTYPRGDRSICRQLAIACKEPSLLVHSQPDKPVDLTELEPEPETKIEPTAIEIEPELEPTAIEPELEPAAETKPTNKDSQITTYFQLIQALLECPLNEEDRLLAAHPELVDAGLVRALLTAAETLKEINNPDSVWTIEWLAAFAAELSQKLGLEQQESQQIDRDRLSDSPHDLVAAVANSQPDEQIDLAEPEIVQPDREPQIGYPELVQALLQCPPNDEDRVLAAHPELVDEGLVNALLETAKVRREHNNPDAGSTIEWLEAFAEQLSQKLGLQPEISEETDDGEDNFFLELLQTVVNSQGDGKIVHPFLDEHLAYLNEHLLASLPQQAKSLLERKEDPDWKSGIASILVSLGNNLQQFPRGNRSINLELSIASYEAALLEYTREKLPLDWAKTQMNRANVYQNRIEGDKRENLEEAIRGYEAALTIFTPSNLPIDALMTSRALGQIYFNQGKWQLAVNTYEIAMASVETSRDWVVNEDRRKEMLNDALSIYENAIQCAINLQNYSQAIQYTERIRSRQLVELMARKDRSTPTAISPDLPRYLEKVEIITYPNIQKLIHNPHTAILTCYTTDDDTHIFIIKQSGAPTLHTCENQGWKKFQNWLQKIWINPSHDNNSNWVEDLPRLLHDIAQRLELDTLIEQHLTDIHELIIVPHLNLHQIPFAALPINPPLESYSTSTSCVEFSVDGALPPPTPPCQGVALTSPDGNALPTSPSGEAPAPSPLQGEGWGGVKRLSSNSNNGSLPEVPVSTNGSNPLLGGVPKGRGGYRVPAAQTPSLLSDRFIIRSIPSCQILQHCQQRPPVTTTHIGTVEDAEDNLPGTGYEAEIIAALYKIPPTNRLRGSSQATAANYRALLARVNRLHSSHHAGSNLNNPLESALLLAQGEKITLGDLLMGERYPHLDEVFLSACQTHVGRATLIDDIATLTTGFLCVGARSVQSTLWSVDDYASVIFNVMYHQERSKGTNRAISLHTAQSRLRNLTGAEFQRDYYPHAIEYVTKHHPTLKTDLENHLKLYCEMNKPFESPFYWAAFITQGMA